MTTTPTYFTIVADYKAFIEDATSDSDYDPQTVPVSATVTFTPLVNTGDVVLATGATPRPTGFIPAPITAIIDPADGRLKLRTTQDSGASGGYGFAPVRLLCSSYGTANDFLELDGPLFYNVRFSDVVFDGGNRRGTIAGFDFEAPNSPDAVLNLITVSRSPGQVAAGVTKIAPGGVRLDDGDIVFSFASVDIPDRIPFTPIFTSNEITDLTATGQAVITAANAAAARTAIGAENAAMKGASGGYTPLDATGKVDAVYLPSYVDDVLSYANEAAFPATGETGKIYVAQDTGDAFRWTGSAYLRISDRVTADGITDSTSLGRDLVRVGSAAAARIAIGAAGVRVVSGTGIDLTGATASDTAFQAILNAAAADAAAGAGIVEVYIPPGILSLTTQIAVGAGVTLRGAGRSATTVRSSSVNGVLELKGASDITIADLTVESTDTGTASRPISSTNTNYLGLQRRFTITGCRITGATSTAVKFWTAIEQLTFTHNIVEDCELGFSLLAPAVASGLISDQITISHNRFRTVGGPNIQLYGAGPLDVNGGGNNTIFNVEISGNDLSEFAQTGPDGPIPIEPTNVTNIRIANNLVDGIATKGISEANCVNATITGNIVRNQSDYAFELNGGRQISLVGNVAENCQSFAMETGYQSRVVDGFGGIQLSDVVIADNVHVGSGRSATVVYGEGITLVTARRVRISGNVFNNWQYVPNMIKVGHFEDGVVRTPVPEDCVIEGNTFVVSDANTPIRVINVQAGNRTTIARNTVRINRDLVAGEFNAVVIGVLMDANVSDTLIEDNHVQFSGTVAAASDVAGVGNLAATPAACAKLTVRGNRIVNGVRGLFLRTNSTDLVVVDNETSTCSGVDSIPATAHGSVGAGSIQLFNSPANANYEKLVARFSSNVAEIGTLFGGSGTARSLRLGLGASAQATPNTAGFNRYLQLNSSMPYAQFLTATSSSGSMVQIAATPGNAFTASEGNQAMLAIDPTLTQSGTAGYTMLLINPTETSNTGSGTKRLIDAKLGGVSRFTVDTTGLVTANALASATTSVATAAGITTLTIASTQTQIFTGSTTQTVKLPTTSVTAGQQYIIINQSSGNVTVQSSAGDNIATLTGGILDARLFIALQNSPTTASHWYDTSALAETKEPAFAAGTAAQYRRGDKTWQTLNADAVPDGTTNKAFLASEQTKLAGIATGATANSTDATLLARANHTGTQLASTISDFSTAADARIAPATTAASSKTTPVDADELPLVDSAASNVLKKLTWANLKSAIATYYNDLTATMTGKTLSAPALTGESKVATSGSVSIYNTADQSTNTERVVLRYTGNVAEIGTLFAGTASARNLRVGSASAAGGGVIRYTQYSSGAPFIAHQWGSTGVSGNMTEVGTSSSFSSSSASQVAFGVVPTINQSGTGSYTALLLNPTETATGSGTKRLIDAQVGGTSKFTVDNAGTVSVSGTAATVRAGAGSPESVVTANIGSMYLRTDGGAGSTLYIKESGTGNTGWVAK